MKRQNSNSYKTVLTITIGFLIVYIITKMEWAIFVSLIIGFIAILSNRMRNNIDFLWMKLTWLLTAIISHILFFIFYFFCLFPIAILSRIFSKKDALNLKKSPNSMFRNKNKQFDFTSFEKPW